MSETKKISIELADTPHKREQGMMWRRHLGVNNGMLFVFPSNQIQSFWMKNTYLSLDLAFISDDGTIFQIETLPPLSTKSTKSKRPCRYVLEMNAGWFARNSISVGKKITNIQEAKSYCKFAQVVNNGPNKQEEEATNATPIDPMLNTNQNPDQNQNTQKSQNSTLPNASINLTNKQKIEQANARNLPIILIYRTEKGNTLPPRKLMPIPNKGYVFLRGLAKDMFQAYDSSPTIKIGEMVIEGGHIKSFFLDNIISIEVQDPSMSNQNNQNNQNNQSNQNPSNENSIDEKKVNN